MRLSKYQMQTFNGWKGLTKDSHLISIFAKQPQRATNFMVKLLAMHYGYALEEYLRRLPVKYFDDDSDYYWEVVGSSRRNIPIVGAMEELGGEYVTTGNLGVGGKPFWVEFSEDWFAYGETIVGEKNEVYPLRIIEEPRLQGSHALYKVELMGGIMTGMPAEELQSGKRFSYDTAFVESELSRAVGDVRFTSPVSMRNEWSTIRIQHKVKGNADQEKLWVGIPVQDGNGRVQTISRWMHYVDLQVERTFAEYKANAIMYGRSNRNANGEYNNLGRSGNVIKVGAGLREQMEVAGTYYYNKFSLKLLNNILLELATNKLSMNNRIFLLKTGSYGALQFHQAVKDVVSGWFPAGYFGSSSNNAAIIQKTNSPLHQNALKAGFQFTEWMAPMGIIVRVEVDPLYDDPVRNKIEHPDGGVAMSYRYDIMDIGTPDQPNIQLAQIKNQPEIRRYQPGLRNPFTGSANLDGIATYDEDSTIIHKFAQLGVMVLDPTRTLSLVPAILQ